METNQATDAPCDVVSHAANLFNGRAKSPRRSLKRRILAALSFDSLDQSPVHAVRSGRTGSRQLVYSAEANDIDLRISVQDDMWVVTGQILREDCEGGSVEMEGLSDSVDATLNELCEFTLVLWCPGAIYCVFIWLMSLLSYPSCN
jgi:hypothetical protein